MTERPIRVVVADDHSVVRAGLREVLATGGFIVVDEAGDAPGAIRAIREHRPDVLVLDITMPGGSGIGIIEEVRALSPDTRILMLSVHDEAEYVLESVRQGAHGYVRKDSEPTELRAAVRAVHEESAYFSRTAARHLTEALQARGPVSLAVEPAESKRDAASALTGREQEVLVAIAEGQTNKQIAGALGISPRTVEAHRDSLMRKLGIHTVAGLTRFAVEAGLIAGDAGG